MNRASGPSPEARWEWISEAVRAFAEQTGELDRLLPVVARYFGSAVNAACVLRLRSADGRFLNPSGLWCPDRSFESALRRTVAAGPVRIDAARIAELAMRSPSPIRLERVSVADFGVELRSEQASITSMIEGSPAIVVPLRGRRDGFGVAYVLRGAGSPPFSAEHEDLLEDLAGQAVVALGHALRIRALKEENAEFRRQALGSGARDAQKAPRDAIVTLAGGLAHDYDNLIAAIRMCTNLLLEHTPPDDPLHAEVEAVRQACDRAAELTPKLSMLAHRRFLEPELLDPLEVIRGFQPGLQELVAGQPRLHIELGESSTERIIADRPQFIQAIIDLVTAACRAASTSELVRLSASFRLVPRENLFGLVPGRYAAISVEYGDGDPAPGAVARWARPVPSRWSEPGAGLPLAAVAAFGHQNGGVLNTAYRGEAGVTVSLFLPVVLEVGAEPAATGPSAVPATGMETVLLALGHVAQRAELRFTLRRHGYQVLDTQTAKHSLDVARAFPEAIHLILVDARSTELAAQLALVRPESVVHPVGSVDEGEGGIDPNTDDASLLSQIRAVLVASLRRPPS